MNIKSVLHLSMLCYGYLITDKITAKTYLINFTLSIDTERKIEWTHCIISYVEVANYIQF